MMSSKQTPGFTLIELVLAVTFGAIILSIVSPELSRANVASNERAAIAALRSIASAQAQLASSAAIDTDGDGVGDYGYFGELAGSAPLRVWDPVSDAPALDANGLTLDPPILPTDFQDTVLDARGEAEVERRGYRFKMYLPSFTAGNHISGIPETGPNGVGGATAGNFPEPDNCEVFWGCYAWPDQAQSTGRRAFFVNQEGRLLQTVNNVRSARTVLVYDGLGGGPDFDAALSNMLGNPNAVTGMGARLGTPPGNPNDGNVWTRIGR
jgi:type II secretory pathway pseudopilin PulG